MWLNNKEYRPEDRLLRHAAGDVNGDRTLATATDMLASTSEI